MRSSIDKVKPIKSTANAMCSVLGYEPWGTRLIDSIKISIAEDIPVLVRFHSGADYPCNNALELDMESHSVLIIGYDDTTEMFTVNDPWEKSLGGNKTGIYTLPYTWLPLYSVNGSLGAALRETICDGELLPILGENHNKEIELSIGFSVPRGYIIDEEINRITAISCKLRVRESNEEFYSTVTGLWNIGEKAKLCFNLGNIEKEKLTLECNFEISVQGKRPYQYFDKQQLHQLYEVDYSTCISPLPSKIMIIDANVV